MLATLIVVFREIIEAGLIVGIVLAATRGVPRRSLWVTYGIGGGLLGACIVAAFAGEISSAFEGIGQEWFNITVLLLAVFMLTWHNVWMARHGREMAVEMKTIGEAVKAGRKTLSALAIVVGVAVLREGSEIVLFLYGIAISNQDSSAMMALGGALGLVGGFVLSALMYFGLLRIPTCHLFRVTGWMLALLAAGMASQAVVFMQQAQIVTVLEATAWDSSAFLSENSIPGKILHTLIGYSDRPSQLQVVVYGVTLTVIFTLMRLFGHAPAAPAKTAMARA